MSEFLRGREQNTRGPLLEVTSIGSGSSGNALLIRSQDAVLLVDCGVGIRRLATALAANGLELGDVDALVVSHEHIDHVREAARFTKTHAAVLSTRGTALAAGLVSDRWIETVPGKPTTVAGFEVVAVSVSHDARQPSGFLVRTSAGAVAIFTDLGCASANLVDAISEARLVVLEANHDETMLRRGPYPAHLQRRILSDSGHLSNAACATTLAAGLRGSQRLPTVWLAHLSESNNRPHLARKSVAQHLAKAGLIIDVHALPRRETSATWSPELARPGMAQLALDLFS
jgi:phosphoribosyl 1,2-cyclic phosphodiesterase